MADATVIYSGPGSLPFSARFNSESDGPALLFAAGSCWSQSPGQTIGLDVLIDGNQVAQLTVCANPATQHLAVVPQLVPVKLSIGPHTLSVSAYNGFTIVDANDNFQFVLVY